LWQAHGCEQLAHSCNGALPGVEPSISLSQICESRAVKQKCSSAGDNVDDAGDEEEEEDGDDSTADDDD